MRARGATSSEEGNGRAEEAEWEERLKALEAFAQERGLSLLEVAIGALAAQPPVASVIAGATKPEQVRANAAVNWEPTPSDLTALRALG